MKSRYFTFVLFLTFFFLIPKPTIAQSCEDSSKCSDPDPGNRYICIAKLTTLCQNLLNSEQQKERTLKSQLTYLETQFRFTQLKIDETSAQINKLENEISILSDGITKLSTTLDNISKVLLADIIQTYKYGNYSTIDLLFSSHGFTDLLEKLKYIKVAQAYDKKKLYELQVTKLVYNDQKRNKLIKQAEAEKLNENLAAYKVQLDQQKKDKAELLSETQNDEGRYQQLIAKLHADSDSLARALGAGGIKLGSVNKGDRIASVGNSGCSTGPHLHFEVITSAHIAKVKLGSDKLVDTIVVDNNQPINGGLDHRTDPRQYIQQGKLVKPTAEYTDNDTCSYSTNPTDPSCNYGDISTRFKQSYLMGIHSGLDIVDFWGAPIYAADSGDSYAFADSQVCNVPGTSGTIGKGIAIDHHNGIVTLYWHIP